VNRSRDSSGCNHKPRGTNGVEHDPAITQTGTRGNAR
jgi:hypothetical protein